MECLFFFYLHVCFLLLSQSFCYSFVHHLCYHTEAFALLQFKQPFQISNDNSFYCNFSFPKTNSWNESMDCCTWDGVTCDLLTGHVIGLDLSCSQLGGTIHPNSSLFQLHHLHTLNLSNNYFTSSSIPNGIGRLRNLRHLDLSHSNFEGNIPNGIGNLRNLRRLDLSDSNFEGNIPNGIGHLRNLRYLDLSYYSELKGNIPTEISFLSNLVYLDLTNFQLQLDERTFETILQNFTNLEVVFLFAVNISSTIPMNMSSSLRYVDLTRTNLQGVLTESFFLLPKLETLRLTNNALLKGVFPKIHPSSTLLELDISYTGISGELPDTIGTLSILNRLDLQGCQFSGQIPDSIGNLTQIRVLIFDENNFTSHIPSTISNLKQLTSLTLASNSLGGEIPDVFSNLQQLRYLDLSNNNFIGPFPSSIISLTHLEHLSLLSNFLSGPLPNNASNLQSLTEMYLSYNSLNGTIPSWVFGLPLLPFLRLDYNWFSGLANELKTNPALESLDLSHNQLSGSFPQSLENLTNLSDLDLSSNNISGDVGTNVTFPILDKLILSSCELKDFPHFLRNVKKLRILDISNNKIHGQIPNWFSGMRWDSLSYLNLSYNSLTGHLPQFHYHNLQFLDLKFNFLDGPLTSSSICNMSSLQLLDLSHNYFSDSIPHCMGSMVELYVLDLRGNKLSGNLPPLCTQSFSLSTIVLNGNRFEGPVPVSLLNCTGLEVLDVGNNAINDTFPAWLGNLQELQVLILKSNKFHGTINACQTKFCFPKLRIFDLSFNEFSGSLPVKVLGNFKSMIKLYGEDTGKIKYMVPSNISYLTSYEDSVRLVIKGQDIELERISTIITTIDLSSNHFEGVIPKSLMNLGSLWLLNLSRNNLRGDIPKELGQLNMLEALDLSWNRLTGKIPMELRRLNFLAVLNLSQNLLVGPIPPGRQFNTFGNDSYGGNLALCGLPLSKECGTSDPSESEEEEGESYFFSGFTWQSVVIGYSFGLVVGTVVWSLMFKYRKPKSLVEFFEGISPKKMRRQKKRNHRRRT